MMGFFISSLLICSPSCCACAAKSTVFEAHLMGKKHLAALRRQGQGAQADALLARAKEQKALGQLKAAHETAKRTLGVGEKGPTEQQERDRKVAKVCFQPGGDAAEKAAAESAAAAAAAAVEAAVDGAARAENAADAPCRPLAAPNGVEWWKGIPRTEEEDDASMTALEKLIAKKGGGGAGTQGGDWKCAGNYLKNKECGVWNYRNADKCKGCGAARRGKSGGGRST
eukprot:SAG22_NODE_11_length_35583_cov_107.128790_9_plen_227_part_00